jgi:hypothetical protein
MKCLEKSLSLGIMDRTMGGCTKEVASMASEKEEMLNQEIEAYEEELRVVASKLQEIAGVDCNFGACVFDPEMQDVEARLADLEKRKKVLAEVKESLEKCDVE